MKKLLSVGAAAALSVGFAGTAVALPTTGLNAIPATHTAKLVHDDDDRGWWWRHHRHHDRWDGDDHPRYWWWRHRHEEREEHHRGHDHDHDRR
jgi:hypothetical protein